MSDPLMRQLLQWLLDGLDDDCPACGGHGMHGYTCRLVAMWRSHGMGSEWQRGNWPPLSAGNEEVVREDTA